MMRRRWASKTLEERREHARGSFGKDEVRARVAEGVRKLRASQSDEEKLRLARVSFLRPEAREKANKSIQESWDNLTPRVRRERIEAATKGRWGNEGSRSLISKRVLEYWSGKTEEEKREHYLSSFGSNEAVERAAESSRRVWEGYTPEERLVRMEGWLNSPVAKENWKKWWASLSAEGKLDWVRVHLRGRRRPTEPEKVMLEWLDTNRSGEWEYNGDNIDGLIVAGKIPDFISVNGQESVIEIFGEYWHDEGEVELLTAHYAKYGFKCYVFWDYEVYDYDLLKERLG